jgi:class III poly(R)-hydroxyalkanoic acid synthase PhaE subunit
MTDNPGESLNWTDVYLKGQEEFVRRWSEMASQATQGAASGASAFGSNPFAGQAFGNPAFGGQGGPNWFAMFQPQFTGPAGDLAKRYFGFYDQYLAAMRSFSEVLTKSMVNPDPAARARAFMEGLQALQQPFTQLWSQSASMFGMPGFQSPEGGTDFLQSLTKSFGNGVELPALGLTREKQESMQRLQKLTGEYLQQQGQLTQLWGGIIGDALKLFGERVGEKLKAGETFTSSKALYDLWIESAETVFAKAAHSPAYAKAQADLGNTVAKLRTEQRIAIEQTTKQYDLPTRDELNTVHRRLKDLKTELRRVNARLDETTRALAVAQKGDTAPKKAATQTRKAK